MLRIRVTAEEKDKLQAAATREGLELSAWVRMICTRAARTLEGT